MIRELLQNPIFVGPAAGWFVAQILKIIIEVAVQGKDFHWSRIAGSGGMPSSHSATVCALVVVTAARYGFSGFELPMAFFFAFIVIYDARGVRRETGEQAKAINAMIEWFEGRGTDIPGPDQFKELIGHSPLQVAVGSVLGIIIGLVISGVYGLL